MRDIKEEKGKSCAAENSSKSVSDPPKEFFPISERKWIDIPAEEHFKAHTLESSISKLVMKLV